MSLIILKSEIKKNVDEVRAFVYDFLLDLEMEEKEILKEIHLN